MTVSCSVTNYGVFHTLCTNRTFPSIPQRDHVCLLAMRFSKRKLITFQDWLTWQYLLIYVCVPTSFLTWWCACRYISHWRIVTTNRSSDVLPKFGIRLPGEFAASCITRRECLPQLTHIPGYSLTRESTPILWLKYIQFFNYDICGVYSRQWRVGFCFSIQVVCSIRIFSLWNVRSFLNSWFQRYCFVTKCMDTFNVGRKHLYPAEIMNHHSM